MPTLNDTLQRFIGASTSSISQFQIYASLYRIPQPILCIYSSQAVAHHTTLASVLHNASEFSRQHNSISDALESFSLTPSIQ